MADETKVEAQAAAEAPAKVAEAVAETVEKVVEESAKVAKRTRAATARRAKREADCRKAGAASRQDRSPQDPHRRPQDRQKAVRAAQKRIETVTNNNFFNGFDAVPAFAPFQSLFADANERSQDLAKQEPEGRRRARRPRPRQRRGGGRGRPRRHRGRPLDRPGRRRSSRNGFEQAADAIRSLAEAKSPTEYLQLQGEFARASFDRAVAESSKLTESLVKLAGEAFQPLSNRASANAERFNTLVA